MTKCLKYRSEYLYKSQYMLGKIEILGAILLLVLLFFLVIYFGAGGFSKNKSNPKIKKYLRSVNILLLVIVVVGSILVLFL